METIKWAVNEMPKTDDSQLQVMSLENVAKARAFHESFPQYSVTPLVKLDHMAAYLGLKEVYVKDESYRFGLNAFKVLGGSFAMARYIAKNIVAAGLARKVEIELAYAIGVAEPVSVYVNTYGTGIISDEDIVKIVREHFDMRPGAIIKTLDLLRPQYRQLAAYGHFGRTKLGVRWEDTDRAEVLKKAAEAYK